MTLIYILDIIVFLLFLMIGVRLRTLDDALTELELEQITYERRLDELEKKFQGILLELAKREV